MKKTLSLIILSAGLLSLTSCLKDNKVNFAPGTSSAVVEFSTAVADLVPSTPAGSPYALYALSYEALPSVSLFVQVGYTGGDPAPADITVNISGNNTAATAAFNTANGYTGANAYTDMPANLFTAPASTVIPKGQMKGNITLKVNTAGFDFSKKYVIPLTITSVSGTSAPISGNYGTILLAVSAKNKYDGTYTVTGTFLDNTNAAFTGQYPITQELRTQSANSVAEYDGYYATNGYAHPFLNAGGQSYYGSYAPLFTMDANDNVTTVTNYYGQPASNGRSARINTGTNKWVISGNSKVMTVSYVLVQAGVDRTFFTETWTRTGDRK